eukprot:SM000016S01879  [mRNA]  locus=s16:350238:354288:- [translate_table: standard]
MEATRAMGRRHRTGAVPAIFGRGALWSTKETVALIEAKRREQARRDRRDGGGARNASQVWRLIAEAVSGGGGPLRDAENCRRKWDNMTRSYKAIVDFNRRCGSPDAYWTMDGAARKSGAKKQQLPPHFQWLVFEHLDRYFRSKHEQHADLRTSLPDGGAELDDTSMEGEAPMVEAGLPVTVRSILSPDDSPVQEPLRLNEAALPVDKLALHLHEQGLPLSMSGKHPQHRQLVLVATGSFNPPTHAHLRMFGKLLSTVPYSCTFASYALFNDELAKDSLASSNCEVMGAYMSPVNDHYGKKELTAAPHRIQMCQLAAAGSPYLMVDSWEASQATYQRTLHVLQRLRQAVNATFVEGQEKVGVLLLCGADLLASMSTPGVWLADQVRAICSEFGIVCITREGSHARKLVNENDALYENRDNIRIVDEWVTNNISSTAVRRCIARGQSVKYLIPDMVLEYIQQHRLYV